MSDLTQSEIDHMLGQINSGDALSVDDAMGLMKDASNALVKAKKLAIDVMRMSKRVDCTLAYGTSDDIKNARRTLHYVAHKLWLHNHGFSDRYDYRQWLKRNIRWEPTLARWVYDKEWRTKK